MLRRSTFLFSVVPVSCAPPAEKISTLRLVNVFGEATVEGGSRNDNVAPEPTEWRFDGSDNAWKAGPGVTGLQVRDGRLVGRASTDIPTVYVERTEGLEDPDTLHSVEIRLRASKGVNLSMIFFDSEEIDVEAAIGGARAGMWPLSSPILTPSDDDELQTYTIKAGLHDRDALTWRSLPSSAIRHVALRPTDESGAEFEIESIRLVFRKEYLASIPSGVSWQGLSEIYRETIVTRSSETLRFEMTLPQDPWLDLAVGTVEESPVTFRVSIAKAGEDETLLEERTVTEAHQWVTAPMDLSDFAGEEVTLVLSVDADADAPSALGFWGLPRCAIAARRRRTPPGPIRPRASS